MCLFFHPEISLSASMSRGRCGSWYKECVWPLKAWPLWPQSVYVVHTGNDSLQFQFRSTLVLTTPANTFKSCWRLLSELLYIFKDRVFDGRVVHWEIEMVGEQNFKMGRNWCKDKSRAATMKHFQGNLCYCVWTVKDQQLFQLSHTHIFS